MGRFLTLLLIPLLLLGRPVPHSHAGSGIVSPDGHDLRPHVHLHSDHHGHHHGHHSHDRSSHKTDDKDRKVELVPVADHDANAVYFSLGTVPVSKQSGSSLVQTLELIAFNPTPELLAEQECRYLRWHPPDFTAKLPIYLLTASLRL